MRWWRGVSRALGPASSARAVLDIAVAPLLELLAPRTGGDRSRACGLRGRSDPRTRAARAAVGVAAGVRMARRDSLGTGHGSGRGRSSPTAARCASRTAPDRGRAPASSLISSGCSLSPRGVAVAVGVGQRGRDVRRRAADAPIARDRIPMRTHRVSADRSATACSCAAAPGGGARAGQVAAHGRRAIAFDQSLTSSIGSCFCCSQRRARWCRCGTSCIARPTRSTP